MTADIVCFKAVLLLKLIQSNLRLLTIFAVCSVPSAVEATPNESGLHQFHIHRCVSVFYHREFDGNRTSFHLRGSWSGRFCILPSSYTWSGTVGENFPVGSAKSRNVGVAKIVCVAANGIRRVSFNCDNNATSNAYDDACVVDAAGDIKEHLVTDSRSGEPCVVRLVVVSGCRAERGKAAFRLIGQARCKVDAEYLDERHIHEHITPRLILRVPTARRRPFRGKLVVVVRTFGITDLSGCPRYQFTNCFLLCQRYHHFSISSPACHEEMSIPRIDLDIVSPYCAVNAQPKHIIE